MIDIVSATRWTETDFWTKSALGISLRRLSFDRRLAAHVAFDNRRGLPEIYNERILSGNCGAVLVFVHDDVWIDDYFLADRVSDGLSAYDVIGVAGNRRRLPRQPAWAFVDTALKWDDPANLTGAVAHGERPFGLVSFFGRAPADCELLDGVLLGARTAALREHNVLFDTRFGFHFYDMDFCRTARQRNLRLGTWPICLTHQSGGRFGSKQWNESLRLYLEKWGD